MAGGQGSQPDGRPGVSKSFEKLTRDLEQGIDWDWLAGLQQVQRFGPVQRVILEAGTRGALLPARYETSDVLMAQVRAMLPCGENGSRQHLRAHIAAPLAFTECPALMGGDPRHAACLSVGSADVHVGRSAVAGGRQAAGGDG